MFRRSVNDYMSDELSPKEAKKIVEKFCKPPYDLEEARLKEAAWKVLQECRCGAFEWEGEEEEEESPKVKKDNAKQGLSSAQDSAKESGGIIEAVKEYGLEIAQNVQSLGAAGSVAFTSATYFQTTEAIETTQEVAAVVENVEHDYGQTINSYFTEQASVFIEKIPYLGETEIAKKVSEKLSEVAENAETPVERDERREAEAEAEVEAEAVEAVETEEAVEEETETEEAAETYEAEESEETDEEADEAETQEVEETENETEVEEETEEKESETETEQSTQEIESEDSSQEASQESTETKSESAVENEEASQDVPEVVENIPADQDIDQIKPHQDFPIEPVITPTDSIPVSPSNQL